MKQRWNENKYIIYLPDISVWKTNLLRGLNENEWFHFHLAPVEGLFFKPKYRANILCICFHFIAVSFLFLSSPWGSVYRFCTVLFWKPVNASPGLKCIRIITFSSIQMFFADLFWVYGDYKTQNRKSNSKQKTSPQSYKIQSTFYLFLG